MGKIFDFKRAAKQISICMITLTMIYAILGKALFLYMQQCFYKKEARVIYDINKTVDLPKEQYIENYEITMTS